MSEEFTFSNHAGLQNVKLWLDRFMGKHKCAKRLWLEEVACSLANNRPLPAIIKEGNTNRDWRAAHSRIETIEILLADGEPEMKSKWKRSLGSLYISQDERFAIRNVGYKSWAIIENDGRSDWEYGTWEGSVYPTLKSAMEEVAHRVKREVVKC